MNETLRFRYPVALTIAGSDSSGGAGIQADLKTFSALGVYGASVITAITAQNTHEVKGIQAISPDIVRKQLEAVFDDLTIDAVKTGMLHNKEAVLILCEIIDGYAPPYVVVDPVMISTSGSRLIENDTIEVIQKELFCRASIITPNKSEAEMLSGISIQSTADVHRAANRLLAMGCQAVLMKGGHLEQNLMTDTLFSTDNEPLALSSNTIFTSNTHGTGCSLSSAIAAYLALGKNIREAVSLSKKYITTALEAGSDVQTGHGHGPLNHFFDPFPLQKIER